jgi:hypothetical protein
MTTATARKARKPKTTGTEADLMAGVLEAIEIGVKAAEKARAFRDLTEAGRAFREGRGSWEEVHRLAGILTRM